MLLAEQPVHQRFVRPGPLVLGSNLLKSPTPTADRDRTVSRRSEPRSRTALMGEQPNPWDQLQPQDATIRHRACLHPCPMAQTISSPCPIYSFEGLAYDSGYRFAPILRQQRAISPFANGMDQSLQGHDGMLVIRQTSHGIVLDSSTSRSEFTVISRNS